MSVFLSTLTWLNGEISILCRCSWFWVRTPPPDQHDGCHHVRLTHVYGLYQHLCWPAQAPCSHRASEVCLSARRLPRSSCPSTTTPRPICGASALSCTSVWPGRLHFAWVTPGSARIRLMLLRSCKKKCRCWVETQNIQKLLVILFLKKTHSVPIQRLRKSAFDLNGAGCMCVSSAMEIGYLQGRKSPDIWCQTDFDSVCLKGALCACCRQGRGGTWKWLPAIYAYPKETLHQSKVLLSLGCTCWPPCEACVTIQAWCLLTLFTFVFKLPLKGFHWKLQRRSAPISAEQVNKSRRVQRSGPHSLLG